MPCLVAVENNPGARHDARVEQVVGHGGIALQKARGHDRDRHQALPGTRTIVAVPIIVAYVCFTDKVSVTCECATIL